MILRVLIQQMRRNHSLDYVLLNSGAQFVIAHGLGMLCGDYDRIHAKHLAVRVVLHRDLGLAVGPQKRKRPVFAHRREPLGQLVRQRNGGGHQIRILIHRIAKHHPLVAGAPGVHAHCDVARLLIDAGDDSAGVGVEAVKSVVVTDGGDGAADHGLEIDIGFGSDFSGDDYEAGGGEGFAGYAAGASSARQASRIASEIWSAILSGWPSVTDSEVNR